MRVTIVTAHDGNLIRGGAEIQVEKTCEALRDEGLEVDVLTPLTREVGDIVHFIGPHPYFWGTADLCREYGVPFVTSPVWYDPRPLWKVTLRRYWLRNIERRYPRQTRHLFRNSLLLFTPSDAVDQRIKRFFDVDLSKCRRVPNGGVEERFAHGDPELFRDHFGLHEPFVLHSGTVGERKNQINLIRALKDTGLRMVFMGKVVDHNYLEQCRKEAGKQALFLPPIPHDSPLLPSAYKAARVVAIPSLLEDFLLAGMEAAVAGARLVLSNSWNPHELYGEHALYPNPHSPQEIKQAVLKAWDTPNDVERQREYFTSRYSWKRVAELLIAGYQEAIAMQAAQAGKR